MATYKNIEITEEFLKEKLVKVGYILEKFRQQEDLPIELLIILLMIVSSSSACYVGMKKPHFLASVSEQWEKYEALMENSKG